jgi:hypothetical protein
MLAEPSLEQTAVNFRRNNPAAQRFAERRQRENDAPRLSAEVPDLVSLRLEIDEQGGSAQPRYIRRIVVDSAPALFLLPCGDPRCVDGGHDITGTVMRALRARSTTFDGSDDCSGSVGSSACARVVRFDAVAEYRA